jgi:hypothetical protein
MDTQGYELRYNGTAVEFLGSSQYFMHVSDTASHAVISAGQAFTR